MRVTNHARRVSALLIAAMFAAGASAQSFVYPAKGQSPEKQKKDEGECHTWAVQQSKYDPAVAAVTGHCEAADHGHRHHAGRGARGAARGAVVDEIVSDDAGAGAAVGAAAARGKSRRQKRTGQQQQQAATQQQQAGMSDYQKARAACLEGRGYTGQE